MKKRIITIVCIVCIVLGLAACSSPKAVVGERQEYSVEQERWNSAFREAWVKENCTTEYDGIEIDGVVDEAVWDNLGWMSFSQYGKTISFTLTYNENGIFWAMKSKDTGVIYNFANNIEGNTSFELLLCNEGLQSSGAQPGMLEVRQDTSNYSMSRIGRYTAGSWSYVQSQEYVFHRWSLIGENAKLNENNMEGLMMEGYIHWSALGIDVEKDGLPATLKAYMEYNYQDSLDKSQRVAYIRPHGYYYQSKSWYHFDAEGYTNSDSRMDESQTRPLLGDGHFVNNLGDGILPKTNAWDLSRAKDGVYSLKSAFDAQYLFFNDVCAENYIVSATVKYNSQYWGSSYAKLGVIAGMTEQGNGYTPYSAMVWGVGSKNAGKVAAFNCYKRFATSGVSEIEIGTNGEDVNANESAWTQLPAAFGNLDTNGEVKLTVIKQGASIIYYVNDVLWTITSNVELAGKTVPGLYAYNCEGEFTNVSCITDQAAIDQAMKDAKLYKVTTGVSGNGSVIGRVYDSTGKLMNSFTNEAYVLEEHTVEFELQAVTSTLRASVLEKLTMNGNDITAQGHNGGYTISGITGNVHLEAGFASASASRKVSVNLGDKTEGKLEIYVLNESLTDHTYLYVVDLNASAGNLVLPTGFLKVVLNGDEDTAKYIKVTENKLYLVNQGGELMDFLSEITF